MGGKPADQPTWHLGRQCEGGACVEIGTLGESVLVRGSTDPEGNCVKLTREEWRVFVAGVKSGDFDGV